jgi:hypothetical protein
MNALKKWSFITYIVPVKPLATQGDQIWRVFAYWAIVYFGQRFENYTSCAIFGDTFFHGTSYVLILTKKWDGLHFGRFFHKFIWSPSNTAHVGTTVLFDQGNFLLFVMRCLVNGNYKVRIFKVHLRIFLNNFSE